MGGLGNQLFQIFTLISYCLKNNNLFVLEKRDVLYGPIRNYDVYWDNMFKQITKHCKKREFNFPRWREPYFHYSIIPTFNKTQHVSLWGYFQSYKYFEKNFEKIINLLKISDMKCELKKKTNVDYKNTISIHFRVGDYKLLQQNHPLMKAEYYIKSIYNIANMTNRDDWNILYFYEENDKIHVDKIMNKIKEIFKNITYTEVNHKLKDWEQMLQMSLCHHNIIANSSFSWWGAYLNNSFDDKIVCYPHVWFGPALIDKNTNDLFPRKWIKI